MDQLTSKLELRTTIETTYDEGGYIRTTGSVLRFIQLASTIIFMKLEEKTIYIYLAVLFAVKRTCCIQGHHRQWIIAVF